MSDKFNNYLEYIGAQSKIGEMRTWLQYASTKEGVDNEDVEACLKETQKLEKMSNDYLDTLLHRSRRKINAATEGVDNGNF